MPLNDERQEEAALAILRYLKRPQKQREGFTHSECYPPVFYGYWRDPESMQLFEDKMIVCIADYKSGPVGPSELIRRLKEQIERIYSIHAEEEQEIWVVGYRTIRH